jgi:hypothetical protein
MHSQTQLCTDPNLWSAVHTHTLLLALIILQYALQIEMVDVEILYKI